MNKTVAVLGGSADAGWVVEELLALSYSVAWVGQEDLPDSPRSDGLRAYPRSRVSAVSGCVGSFRLELSAPPERAVIDAAAIIVAMGNQRLPLGADARIPAHPRVLSTQVLAERLSAPRQISGIAPAQRQHILFALDMLELSGKQAVVETLELALRTHDTWHCEVSVLYRELQVDSDLLESLTRTMREQGIVFHRLQDALPVVDDSGVHVKHADGVLDGDLLVIAPVVRPRSDSAELAGLLRIALGADGYFQQLNVRSYRPGLSNRKGIYLAGRCHLDADDAGARADAAQAAANVAILLGQDHLQPETVIAEVGSTKCIRCLTCIRTCPHAAVELAAYGQVTAAKVVELACFGCGACAANCPVRAITMKGIDVPVWLQEAALV
ncbi:MAG: 4Fe-4S binding protein [Chloroflexi bacterium]|nr:4Fe-4S binding protein [Chloroflexota bacterium]